jgi:hypothetical protein
MDSLLIEFTNGFAILMFTWSYLLVFNLFVAISKSAFVIDRQSKIDDIGSAPSFFTYPLPICVFLPPFQALGNLPVLKLLKPQSL